MAERQPRITGMAVKVLLVFFWLSALSGTDAYFSVYLLTALAGLGCMLYNNNMDKTDSFGWRKKDRYVGALYTAVLSGAAALANYGQMTGFRTGAFWSFLRGGLVFVAGLVPFGEMVHALYTVGTQSLHKPTGQSRQTASGRKVFLAAWVSILAVYLCFLWLDAYPGVLSYDSFNEIEQIFTGNYTNHHPFYYTMVIRFWLWLGMALFQDINAAVALYSGFSVLMMSLSFAYVVETIFQITQKRKIAIAVWLFYMLAPYHIRFSYTMWKDVFFGAAVMLFAASFVRLQRHIGQHEKWDMAVLAVSGLLICLFRSNGFIAFVLSVAVFAVLLGRKNKKLLLVFITTVAVAYVLKYPVLSALQIPQTRMVNSLSVPVQQIARVIEEERPLTAEQTELLGRVVDISRVKDTYKSWIADPMRGLVFETGDTAYLESHKAEYLKLYIQLGLQNPQQYIAAWVDQTKGYWNGGYGYPKCANSVDVNTLGIYQTTRSTPVSAVLYNWVALWEYSPLLQPLQSIGLAVWLIWLASYIGFVKRDKTAFFVAVPFLAVIATLMMATPVYAEFRYSYAVFCGGPIVLTTALTVSNRETLQQTK